MRGVLAMLDTLAPRPSPDDAFNCDGFDVPGVVRPSGMTSCSMNHI